MGKFMCRELCAQQIFLHVAAQIATLYKIPGIFPYYVGLCVAIVKLHFFPFLGEFVLRIVFVIHFKETLLQMADLEMNVFYKFKIMNHCDSNSSV